MWYGKGTLVNEEMCKNDPGCDLKHRGRAWPGIGVRREELVKERLELCFKRKRQRVLGKRVRRRWVGIVEHKSDLRHTRGIMAVGVSWAKRKTCSRILNPNQPSLGYCGTTARLYDFACT